MGFGEDIGLGRREFVVGIPRLDPVMHRFFRNKDPFVGLGDRLAHLFPEILLGLQIILDRLLDDVSGGAVFELRLFFKAGLDFGVEAKRSTPIRLPLRLLGSSPAA